MAKREFKFSSDVLSLSAEDFKKVMQDRYKLPVKEINELYKQLHGHDTDISNETSEGQG